MKYPTLTREDIRKVIEGRGNACRVPVLFNIWLYPSAFGEQEQEVRDIIAQYPDDIQVIHLGIPDVYNAPADDPSYRWSYMDRPEGAVALDQSGCIEDWDEQLDDLLADFPSPEYHGLIPECPPDDGRYRVGHWWYFFFERFWSIRGMEDALTDFYLYPDAVHALFRKLTDFYKRMITRAHDELKLDAIFTSDDLGTQVTTFFSPAVFDEFFAPYYKEVIDHIHSLGMHFWLHTCGNIEQLIPRFVELGVDVLHPIQKYTMDEKHIAETYGDKITIWAGFDVQRTIPFGTPEDVRQEVRMLMNTYARPDGRYMLTFGNGITPDTPLESLRAVYDEAFSLGTGIVKKWN